MYIAITKKKYKDRYHKQILLRESYREDGKVKTRTLANLTNKPKEQIVAMAEALKKNKGNKVSIENLEQGKTIGFSLIILFIMNLLGIVKAIGKSFDAKIALLLIAARITIQSSRLQALYWAKKEDHILNILNFTEEESNKLDNKNIYLGLDYLYRNKEKIEDKLFKSYYKKNPPKCLYYDVTSSYVEGDYSDSELVAYGYNRDKKSGKAQIVMGLLTDGNGHAISIDTYKGNTNDVKTFTDQLNKIKNRFQLEGVTIVGDGGMIKSNDIDKIKELGYNYITSIGKPSIRKLLDEQPSKIQMSLFDENLQEVIDEEVGLRYILRQNPTRRDEIRATRESKIERLKACIKEKSDYYNTHYKAEKKTMINHINKKLSSLKLKSFVSYEINYVNGDCKVKRGDKIKIKAKEIATITIKIDEEAKKKEEELDGCYVIKTSLTDITKETKENIHRAYKTLIKVENAFKTLKTQYLEIRPLYVRTDKRIIGHTVVSMLAYNVVLKLKEYTNLAGLDFKSTIRQLKSIKSVSYKLKDTISFNFIPGVCKEIQGLFNIMKFKLSTKLLFL
jgi:transposase